MQVLIKKHVIQNRVDQLARDINKEYEKKDLIMICVLKGAFMFFADLVRLINFPVKVDFITLSSYEGKESTGIITIKEPLKTPIKGKHVLIVEDIIDTGKSLSKLQEVLLPQNPASLKICVLLDKKIKREIDIPVQYTGFTIPDKFVVGYGLDFNEEFRNLPFVGDYSD